jgi:hypothetical protein
MSLSAAVHAFRQHDGLLRWAPVLHDHHDEGIKPAWGGSVAELVCRVGQGQSRVRPFTSPRMLRLFLVLLLLAGCRADNSLDGFLELLEGLPMRA